MANSKLTFYPVDNGDTVLIQLANSQSILVDCNIRKGAEGTEDESKYDVKADLLKRISKRTNIPFIDSFILTHPDQDHCRGFESNFYLGDPSKYSKTHLEEKKIFIDELWFAPKIIKRFTSGGDLCDDAKAFKKEAERRLELHKKSDANRFLPGNRIIVIGYNDNPDLKGLDDNLRFIPGDKIKEINMVSQNEFSFFVHAPFKEEIAKSANDKNNSSLVLQARFTTGIGEIISMTMLGGDADHNIWKKILDKSKQKGNHDALKWDLFLAPHHCSWTFFNDTKYEDNKEPTESSLEIIGKENQLEGAKIIASCKPIKNNDDDPPHYAAKKEYLKVLQSKDDFLVTSETPNSDSPEPLVFEITKSGPSKQPFSEKGTLVSGGGIAGAINAPRKQG